MSTETRDLQRRKPQRRIAQKLFLFYVLPLSVLIVAGLAVPVFLWSYFGHIVEEYNSSQQFVEHVSDMARAADDSQTQIIGSLLTGDMTLLTQFKESRRTFGSKFGDADLYLSSVGATELSNLLGTAREHYVDWANHAFNLAKQVHDTQDQTHIQGKIAESEVRVGYVSVENDLSHLLGLAQEYRNQYEARKNTANFMRRITSVAIPLAALLLSFLIGRSIALGITRPLEALTEATEELERGNADALLTSEDTRRELNDEIGDLQRAFLHMAHTIGQREAMLRAQNEALGALNQRIEAVMNATNDGIALLDRAGAFSVVNQRFADLFGLESDVILDQTFAEAAPLLLSRFRNRADARERLEQLVSDPNATVDETFEVIEPVVRTLRLYSAPVRGDQEMSSSSELLGRIFVFRDVTRETLVDRMKTEFVSTVSHELRTPLTAIKGYVDLMVGGQTGAMNEVQTEFLTMVQSSTRRLTSLINDILDISRIESGRMEMREESVDYVPLVRQVARMMTREAQLRKIDLSVEVANDNEAHSPVVGDADRITQVLVNFLSNGIKYTPVGGKVTVRIEFEHDFVTTCVADTGIGIAPEDQKRLFQKFFRADNSTTRETGGTGLGLAITKAILEKLHGSIWVESEPGVGSKFWFTLPTARPTDSGETDTASGQRLVLSIDSDAAALHWLGHQLRHQGFVTANATSESEALRRARGLHPDIITLDPLTPGMNGFALLRTLRQNDALRSIPVALLALHIEGGQAEIADATTYLPWTVSDTILLERVRAALYPGRTLGGNVLVVGDEAMIQTVEQDIKARNNASSLVTATTLKEADSRIGGHIPDVIVLYTEADPEGIAGRWIARLRRSRPGERIWVIALCDPELLTGNIQPLVTFGGGPLPLDRIGDALQRMIEEQRSLAAV